MTQLDSVSQSVIDNNSYEELFLQYSHFLNYDYPATAGRMLDLIEQKLSEELQLNSIYINNFRGYKNPQIIDMVLKVNDRQHFIREMINNVLRIRNSKNLKDVNNILKNIQNNLEM